MTAKNIKKLVSVMILIVMSLNGIMTCAAEAQDESGVLTVSNQYIRYSVNRSNGRFIVDTIEGSPGRDEDNNLPLLFKEKVPDTSFTTFYIDGKTYIFGNSYEYLGLGNNFKSYPTTSGYVNQATWSIDGIDITQSIEILENLQTANSGNVRISYKVKNTSGKEVQIGSRMLFDTFTGTNDASPIMLPGKEGYISTESRLEGSDVPVYWKAVDDKNAPKVVAYGILSGWNNLVPDSVTFAHWESLSSTKWDYVPDTGLDFTSTSNSYSKADSAVALTWSPAALGASEERLYETYYGLGDISAETGTANFTAASYGPSKLTINDAGTGYKESPFSVGLQLDNTLTDSQVLTNVKATLEFSYGLKLADGETAEKTYSSIGINEIKNIGFNLTALPHYKTGLPYYKITLTMDNLVNPIEKRGSILIPSLGGTPPEISFTSFAPYTLYNKDDKKYITIAGSGFDLLKQDNNYGITLTNTATNEATAIPAEYVTVSSGSITAAIPNTLTNACKEGVYKVTANYSYQGVRKTFDFGKNLAMSSQEQYKVNEYKVLRIVRKKLNGDYRYDIVQSATEKDLAAVNAGETVLLEIRGNIQELKGVYTINDQYTTINSLIKYEYDRSAALYSPSPLTITKKDRDLLHDNSYVSITGSGMMYLGNFPFSVGEFCIELEDKTMYTVEPEDDGEEDAEPVKVVPAFIGFKIPNIEGLPITVKSAVIGKNFVSFGGALDFGQLLTSTTGLLSKKDEKKTESSGGSTGTGSTGGTSDVGKEEGDSDGDIAFALNVEELRFSVSSSNPNTLIFQGINAGGKVGIPKDVTSKIIPGLDIGASAEVQYNTFDNECLYLKTDMDFFIISASAEGRFKMAKFGNVSLLIPDKIVVYGGFEPGIPIIPVTPVAYITNMGGGFDNVYDTVTGNFITLPPLTLKAIGGLSIAKVFSADKITLTASLRTFSISADSMKISGVDILENVTIGWNFEDTDMTKEIKFKAELSAEVDIFGVITGDGCIYLGVDSTKNGLLGPLSVGGYINGNVGIPKYIPFIGGIKLAGVSAGVSDENIYAKLKIIGIPIGIKYVWGSSTPIMTFSSASPNGTAPAGQVSYLASESETGEDGTKSTIIFGDNIRTMKYTSSKRPLRASELNNFGKDMAGAGDSIYQYTFSTSEGQAYALIEASYEDEALPAVTLTDPSGDNVQMVEGTNYMVQTIAAADSESGETERRIYISLVNPAAGSWTLSSNKQLTFNAMDVAPIPALSSISAGMDDGKIHTSWAGTDLDGTTMSFFLCRNNTDDPGTLISEGIAGDSDETVIDVPEGIDTGEYYLRAQLMGDGKNYSNLYASEKLSIIDPNQPASPADLTVAPAGDGLLYVNWDASSDAEGYFLEVFDSEDISQGMIEVKDGKTSALIGGKYGSATTGETGGIIPGKAYRVELVAYKTVNNLIHTATPVVSDSITVPVPSPAATAFVPLAALGQLQEKTGEDGLIYYTTNSSSITLNFSSDQQVDTTVQVNGEEMAEISGTAWEKELELDEGENIIFGFSTNDSGDSTVTGFRIICDTAPPELKIECPQIGELVTGSTVEVRGSAEINTTVTVNGIQVAVGDGGVFETAVDIGNDMYKDITIVAEDEALNKTVYKTTVYNNNVSDIKKVVIKEEKSTMGVMEEQELSLWAIDNKGNQVRINPSLVTWELLDGAQCSSLSDEGRLKATAEGRAIVRAAFAVAGDFEFEDAIIVDIGSETEPDVEGLQISPSRLSMEIGEQQQLEAYVAYSDSTTEKVDGSEVEWEVATNNNSSIALSTAGMVTALRAGTSVVKASCEIDGKTYEVSADVTVSRKTDNDDSGSKSHRDSGNSDKKILDALNRIIEYTEAQKDRIIISAAVKAEIDAVTGKAEARLTEADILKLMENLKKHEADGTKVIPEIKIDNTEAVSGVDVTIPGGAFKSFADNTSLDTRINTGIGTITFNARAVDAISTAAASGDITISIAKADTSSLTAEMKKLIGDRPVYDFSVRAGTMEVTGFGGGAAEISIPYVLKPGEDKNAVVVYFIDGKGGLRPVRGRYDEATGSVIFITEHFSRYAVGYNKVGFKDVPDTAWYSEAVEFIAARGIVSGTGNGNYSPGMKLTRGQFMVMIMKAYGIDPDQKAADNFADAGDTYYTGYLAAAKRLGISAGKGNNRFEPDKEITRQEMITLLYGTLEKTGELPLSTKGNILSKFGDSNEIASWAKDAMALFAGTGIISGSNGRLRPADTASRAEMAQVLYKLLTDN